VAICFDTMGESTIRPYFLFFAFIFLLD